MVNRNWPPFAFQYVPATSATRRRACRTNSSSDAEKCVCRFPFFPPFQYSLSSSHWRPLLWEGTAFIIKLNGNWIFREQRSLSEKERFFYCIIKCFLLPHRESRQAPVLKRNTIYKISFFFFLGERGLDLKNFKISDIVEQIMDGEEVSPHFGGGSVVILHVIV